MKKQQAPGRSSGQSLPDHDSQTGQTLASDVSKDHDKHEKKTEGCEFC